MTALFGVGLLAAVLGSLIGYVAARLPVTDDEVVASIDALLPQTQCAQCGYPGCRPYAQAIAVGGADINQCPPGGDATVAALASLLERDITTVDPHFGESKPPQVAAIDEQRCIGCALCLPACPVDAIIGSNQQTHTVIADHCTGCELCVAPCPVDCIALSEIAPQ